ncbi:hypothetical protein D9M71_812870 [compost metagenome]
MERHGHRQRVQIVHRARQHAPVEIGDAVGVVAVGMEVPAEHLRVALQDLIQHSQAVEHGVLRVHGAVPCWGEA